MNRFWVLYFFALRNCGEASASSYLPFYFSIDSGSIACKHIFYLLKYKKNPIYYRYKYFVGRIFDFWKVCMSFGRMSSSSFWHTEDENLWKWKVSPDTRERKCQKKGYDFYVILSMGKLSRRKLDFLKAYLFVYLFLTFDNWNFQQFVY